MASPSPLLAIQGTLAVLREVVAQQAFQNPNIYLAWATLDSGQKKRKSSAKKKSSVDVLSPRDESTAKCDSSHSLEDRAGFGEGILFGRFIFRRTLIKIRVLFLKTKEMFVYEKARMERKLVSSAEYMSNHTMILGKFSYSGQWHTRP